MLIGKFQLVLCCDLDAGGCLLLTVSCLLFIVYCCCVLLAMCNFLSAFVIDSLLPTVCCVFHDCLSTIVCCLLPNVYTRVIQ